MATSTYERGLARRANALLHPTYKVAITGTAEDLAALTRVVSPDFQTLPGSVAAIAQVGMELNELARKSLGNGHADEAAVALTESPQDRTQG